MKYLVVLADGLADEPVEELNNRTVVMAANTPNIDELCRRSVNGLLKTVPDSLHPGSEVANMTIMGFDAEKCYQGRGVLEAAAIGVAVEPGDLVMRCNIVCAEGDRLINHSAGHISTAEADELIKALNESLGNDRVKFYTGVSYRHVLVIKNGSSDVDLTPPHDVPGEELQKIMPRSTGSSPMCNLITKLIVESRSVLENHPVNIQRRLRGLSAGNMIWPWSPGHKPQMPRLADIYGFKNGVVISAVDLIHGIGKLGGLTSIYVNGATGLYDTNYGGKANAALEALKTNDYVFLHIEAPDEAGHEGDFALKIRTIEDIDRFVVAPVLQYIDTHSDVTVAFLPDHPTPCKIRTHTRKPVPFMIYRPGQIGDSVTEYNEANAAAGSAGYLELTQFMSYLTNQNSDNSLKFRKDEVLQYKG